MFDGVQGGLSCLGRWCHEYRKWRAPSLSPLDRLGTIGSINSLNGDQNITWPRTYLVHAHTAINAAAWKVTVTHLI